MSKTYLITGPYSGIGKPLCRTLAREGATLILLGRRPEALTQLKNSLSGAEVHIFSCDLSDPIDLQLCAKNIASQVPVIDGIFHLAGYLEGGQAKGEAANEESVDIHFRVNTFAPLKLTQLLMKNLGAAEAPVVVVAGSGARSMVRHLAPQALLSSKTGAFKRYAQSKFLLREMFLAQREAFEAGRIEVMDIAPTKTDMAYSNSLPFVFRLFRFLFKQPEQVSAKLLELLNAPGEGKADRMLKPAEIQAFTEEMERYFNGYTQTGNKLGAVEISGVVQ